MNHYPGLFLKEGKNSLGFYATKKPKNLIVFVHGFNGSALSTWNESSGMMTQDTRFSDADIIFYGYNSLKGQVSDQGRILKKFLSKYIQTLPANFYDQNRGIDYHRVIIAAHSQGAIVSRFALIAAIESNENWREKCRLVLFAPAHHGSRLHNLMLAIPGLGKPIALIAGFFYSVISTLEQESKELKDLEKLVENYRATSEEKILKAHTLEAEGDKVVINWPYCYDEFDPHGPVEKSSHTQVCKPIPQSYPLPIDLIHLKLL